VRASASHGYRRRAGSERVLTLISVSPVHRGTARWKRSMSLQKPAAFIIVVVFVISGTARNLEPSIATSSPLGQFQFFAIKRE